MDVSPRSIVVYSDSGWEGEHGKGFPIVQSDHPELYEEILHRAAG